MTKILTVPSCNTPDDKDDADYSKNHVPSITTHSGKRNAKQSASLFDDYPQQRQDND